MPRRTPARPCAGCPSRGASGSTAAEPLRTVAAVAPGPVMDLVEKKTGLNMELSLGPKKVKAQELTVMTRQLATMISSGMTLLRTFYVLEEQIENKLLRERVRPGTASWPHVRALAWRRVCGALSGSDGLIDLRRRTRAFGSGSPSRTAST